MWPGVGNFTYFDAKVFKLQDVTSDDGVYWDTQDNLTVINYPDLHSGSLNWLNYKGHWGNKVNCWQEGKHDVCDTDSGPEGPLRPELLTPFHGL
jgi:hypothetical protein